MGCSSSVNRSENHTLEFVSKQSSKPEESNPAPKQNLEYVFENPGKSKGLPEIKSKNGDPSSKKARVAKFSDVKLLFEYFDKDSNGSIELDEFALVANELGMELDKVTKSRFGINISKDGTSRSIM
jgi:hypothetical protein